MWQKEKEERMENKERKEGIKKVGGKEGGRKKKNEGKDWQKEEEL